MPNYKEITLQLRSFQNTKKITRTMYMISSSKFQKPVKKIGILKRYIEVLERVVASINKEGGKNFLLEKGKGNKTAMIVVTADLGLCGGFNHNVIRLARKYLEENKQKTFDIFGIGKKAKGLLQEKHKGIALGEIHQIDGFFKRYDDLGKLSSKFMDEMIEKIFSGEYEEVVIFHNQYKSMMVQEVKTSYLVPFLKGENENSAEKGKEAGDEIFIVEEEVNDLIKSALRDYLKAYFYLVAVSSYAGENATRMVSMDKAVTNADNLISGYTLKKNTYRQTKITTEVAEIAAGAGEES